MQVSVARLPGLNRCAITTSSRWEVLEIGTHIDSEQTIYAYDDYAIYHVAKVCADSSIINRFCHPKLDI
jgi:hypothetical protein